jgi:ABC-type amino acid transport substrate-binding protein
MNSIKFSIIFIASFFCNNYTFSQEIIKHSLSASQNDETLSYELMVLKLILDKSKQKFGDYMLIKSDKMSQSRSFQELNKNNPVVHVVATMTSIERESLTIPIRFCIFKGLLGVRIPIVLKKEKPRLENVKTLENLKHLKAGQVFDWPDSTILQKNNINVITSLQYQNLFPMLERKRFDIFPLGALEVYEIAKERQKKYEIDVISNWAIVYPTGYYFFVSKKNKKLADRLNYGFISAIEDGSFNKLFEKFNNEFLAKSNLNSRNLFYLKNPILPKTTLFNNQKFWHPIIYNYYSH